MKKLLQLIAVLILAAAILPLSANAGDRPFHPRIRRWVISSMPSRILARACLVEHFAASRHIVRRPMSGKVTLDFIGLDRTGGSIAPCRRQDFFQQRPQLWNIPLAVAQLVQQLAFGIARDWP